ncbi:hypothetical protein WB334_25630, partial [Escherichia coli]|uniref:acyltransferase family protein n=1 Tax=Escherichia coli TaxID=562 RepID=UPI002157142E
GLALVGLVLHLSLIQTGLWATLFAGLCVYSSQAVLVNSKWLERIGFWSYGIYLWHFPISAYLTNEMLDTPPWVAFAVTFAGATALSALTFHFFENPVRHLKLPHAVTFGGTAAVIAACWIALGLLSTPTTAPVYVDEPGQSDARSALPLT